MTLVNSGVVRARATTQQEKGEMKRELWRIEDVMAGLSGSKANYKVTIASVQNPGWFYYKIIYLCLLFG